MRNLIIWLSFLIIFVGCNQHERHVADIQFQQMEMGKQADVSCIDLEPNGGIWLGLDGKGLAHRESATAAFKFYSKLEGTMPSDVVTCIYHDSHNRQWFGSFGNGIFYWDGSQFCIPNEEGLKTKQIEYVAGFQEDNYNRIWIATQQGGLAVCDTTGLVRWFNKDNSPLATNWLADLKTFDGKTIYVATGWGLFTVDTQREHIAPLTDNQGKEFLARQLIRIMYADGESLLWIGTRTGLYVYQQKTHGYIQLTTADGLGDNFVKAIGRDKQGNTWVTSDSSITRITPTSDGKYLCQVFRPSDGIGDGVFHVRAIACNNDGDMLFGHSKGVLIARCRPTSAALHVDNTPTILMPEGGYIWVMVFSALVLLVCIWIVWRRWYHSSCSETETAMYNTPTIENGAKEAAPVLTNIEPSHIEIMSVDEQLKAKAISLVEQNISDTEFSVEQLANALGMTRGHLYKRLMAITGQSPQEFIRTIRIKHARQLLEKSVDSISQVAWRVGMSPKQFAKYFKEEYGLLPSDFVKQQK